MRSFSSALRTRRTALRFSDHKCRMHLPSPDTEYLAVANSNSNSPSSMATAWGASARNCSSSTARCLDEILLFCIGCEALAAPGKIRRRRRKSSLYFCQPEPGAQAMPRRRWEGSSARKDTFFPAPPQAGKPCPDFALHGKGNPTMTAVHVPNAQPCVIIKGSEPGR